MYKVVFDKTKEKVTHKDVFGAKIKELAAADPEVIYLDADLMNSAGTYKFWRENPDRAINCGIAEANMMGVAAGLSMVGKKPFVHTFGPFASRRCFDQVFLSIGYAGNSVRIFGSDPGVAAAFNGGTHMPFEDMALMRAVPGSHVFDFADGVEFGKILEQVKDLTGLTYMRSTRKNYYKIYSEDSEFTIGKGNILREGDDLTIIACGLMVGEAMVAAEKLAEQGVEVRVVDMFTVKPIDRDLVVESAKKTGALVVAENHNAVGGLGDAVAAVLTEQPREVRSAVMLKNAVVERFGQVGPVDFLQEEYGLTADHLVETCKKALLLK